jgi:hypothetical protein
MPLSFPLFERKIMYSPPIGGGDHFVCFLLLKGEFLLLLPFFKGEYEGVTNNTIYPKKMLDNRVGFDRLKEI